MGRVAFGNNATLSNFGVISAIYNAASGTRYHLMESEAYIFSLRKVKRCVLQVRLFPLLPANSLIRSESGLEIDVQGLLSVEVFLQT